MKPTQKYLIYHLFSIKIVNEVLQRFTASTHWLLYVKCAERYVLQSKTSLFYHYCLSTRDLLAALPFPKHFALADLVSQPLVAFALRIFLCLLCILCWCIYILPLRRYLLCLSHHKQEIWPCCDLQKMFLLGFRTSAVCIIIDIRIRSRMARKCIVEV